MRPNLSPKAQQPGKSTSEGRRKWVSLLSSLILCHFVLFQALDVLDDAHSKVKAIFTQPADPNAHIFHVDPHRHSQKYCFTNYLLII